MIEKENITVQMIIEKVPLLFIGKKKKEKIPHLTSMPHIFHELL